MTSGEREIKAWDGGPFTDVNMRYKPFSENAARFMEVTQDYVNQGVNPGDYYKAIWCRDASYILKDQFLAGNISNVMHEILYIWSHQITPGRERIVYGRGSPEMRYLSKIATLEDEGRFQGALPSTIYYGFSEVYAKNPDIDSTALMISSTSWILDNYLKAGMATVELELLPSGLSSASAIPTLVSNCQTVIDFVVPRMLKAVDYLASRDIDNDGLLEQEHNEDWMDTVLRAGKIVYSQACWILALNDLSSLLGEIGNKEEAERIAIFASKATKAVEQNLWSEEAGSYMDDIQESHNLGQGCRALTQDVSLYLVALTEKTARNVISAKSKRERGGELFATREGNNNSYDHGISQRNPLDSRVLAERAIRTLDAIKQRIWKNRWPLVTEAELKKTGPWILDPNQYQNHTFWPWITGIEMLARSRFAMFEECDTLLSILSRKEHPNEGALAYYEWVHPVSGRGSGAFPFRTGISSVRMALIDTLVAIGRGNGNVVTAR